MDITQIRKLLMTYEEYKASSHHPPHIYKVRYKDQWLYYFGSKHSFNPSDPQFNDIKNCWNEFLDTTNKKSCIALVEGGVRKLHRSEQEAIQNDGEPGLVTYLANKDSILVDSPEPSRAAEMQGFENIFSRDEVEYYYFARMVYQWNQYNPKPDFEKYITGVLASDKQDSGWTDYDFSLENMKKIHKELFGNEFDENDAQFFLSIINPTSNKTVINRYSNYKGVTRDAFIVKNVVDRIMEGKSVFIVYGFTHAVIQEPVYRQILKI